jgi:hypothetical protein
VTTLVKAVNPGKSPCHTKCPTKCLSDAPAFAKATLPPAMKGGVQGDISPEQTFSIGSWLQDNHSGS